MIYTAAANRYDDMEYRRIGNSGLKVPAVSLGLWHNFGDNSAYDKARSIILGAFDMGITHFDLANNYGEPAGSAEKLMGRVLHDDLSAYRDEILITSKAGYYMWPGPYGEWGSKKSLLASLDQSLQRLNVDYVDIFYHHRPDPDTPLEETAEALCQAVKSGKALYVGISNYAPKDIIRMKEILSGMGVHLLVSQARSSMLNRKFENGELDVLKQLGMGAVAFCPLAEGILTSKYLGGIPSDSRAAGKSIFLNIDTVEHYLPVARALNEIALERGQSLSRLAIQWALRDKTMASLILGASRLTQLQENIAALHDTPLTNDELSRINEIIRDVPAFY